MGGGPYIFPGMKTLNPFYILLYKKREELNDLHFFIRLITCTLRILFFNGNNV